MEALSPTALAYHTASMILKELPWDTPEETFLDELRKSGLLGKAQDCLKLELRIQRNTYTQPKAGLQNLSLQYMYQNKHKVRLRRSECFKTRYMWVESKKLATALYLDILLLKTALKMLRAQTYIDVASTYEESEPCT